MAKKTKKIEIIHVKKPIIGETYYFYFAGGWEIGKLDCASDKLTETYGHRWFTFVNGKYGREMRYPVSIYNIRKEKPKKETDV
tara:strand:+ start:1005 stop:1253 length:249 start_codon:yes stop_codon:yes gene_type:complete